MDVSVQATIVTIVTGIASSALAWCFRLESTMVRLSTLSEIAEKVSITNSTTLGDHSSRLTKVEQAHLSIASAVAVQASQNQQIIEKLGVISELKVAVENLKDSYDGMATRREVELMHQGNSIRLSRIEESIKSH
jgi:hypothetical protein